MLCVCVLVTVCACASMCIILCEHALCNIIVPFPECEHVHEWALTIVPIVFSLPVDDAVAVSDGQGDEGRLQGHVTDEC